MSEMSTGKSPRVTGRYIETTVVCDRCHKTVAAIIIPGLATGGFYETGPGSGWERYANPGETQVCDRCMHQDARYVAEYGTVVFAHTEG